LVLKCFSFAIFKTRSSRSKLEKRCFWVTQKRGICFVLMTNPSSQGESSGSSDAPRPRRNFDRSKSVGTFLFSPNNETKVAAF
jgi:hypothetical protein